MLQTRAQFITANYAAAKKATKGSGVFIDTLMTQAILESAGKVGGFYYPEQSKLAKDFNNYFGIKFYPGYKGKIAIMQTREEDAQGNEYFVNAKFCAYNNFYDSAKGYVHFLQNNARYKKAGVFLAKNATEQLKAIFKSGYATALSYETLLLNVLQGVQKITSTIKETAKNYFIPGAIITASILYLYRKKIFKND